MGCFSSKTVNANFTEKTWPQAAASPFKSSFPIQVNVLIPEMPVPSPHGRRNNDLTGRVQLDGAPNTTSQTSDVYAGRILPAEDKVCSN
jgi:hypothetical protein